MRLNFEAHQHFSKQLVYNITLFGVCQQVFSKSPRKFYRVTFSPFVLVQEGPAGPKRGFSIFIIDAFPTLCHNK